MGKCGGHFDPQASDILGRKQGRSRYYGGLSSGLVDFGWMDSRPARKLRADGNDIQSEYQPEEQEDGVGQFVASSLDPAE
jgi:hypothetical protein